MKVQIIKGEVSITSPSNREIFSLYLREIAKNKPLSREEEVSLFREYRQTKDLSIREKICKHNLLFVLSVAKKYQTYVNPSIITLEDLISEGNCGLATAVDSFDPETGNKFISYAIWHIKREMLHCIQQNLRSVRMPTHLQSQMKKVMKAKSVMEQQEGRGVNGVELYDALREEGILTENDDMVKLNLFLSDSVKEKSLSDFAFDSDDITFEETIATDEPSPVDVLEKKEWEERIKLLLDELPEDVRRYVVEYYLSDEKITFRELGKKYGISSQGIQQKIEKHFRRLRFKHKFNRNYFGVSKRTYW